MKRTLFFLILLLSFGRVFSVETLMPTVDRYGSRYASIYSVDVDLDETAVLVDFKLFFKENSSPYHPFYRNPINSLWITISRGIVLTYIDPLTKERIELRATELWGEYEMAFDKKYYFNDFLRDDGKYYPYITITFPSIPADVDKISIYEDTRKPTNSFWWENIHISPLTIGETLLLTNNIDSISHMISTTANNNAGIYEKVGDDGVSYTLAYLKHDNKDYLIYIDSDDEHTIWQIGEVKAELRPTISSNSFKATWYNRDKSKNTKCTITFSDGLMKVLLNENVETYIKMEDNSSNNHAIPNQSFWSGTGFALYKGYIVTNYHVIKDATNIEIFGINRDISKSYKAEIIGIDKINDLALLKINDENFASFGNIPYSIKQQMGEVGEDIYVLGYPLTTTMGVEIKLTNGIISARSGYDGDVSLYQISAPIQPGNSGGPLFDKSGNLIGVICAKHTGAENAGYAIKMSYLRNLVESVADLKILPSKNIISNLELKDQVKQITPFVFLIKCSN